MLHIRLLVDLARKLKVHQRLRHVTPPHQHHSTNLSSQCAIRPLQECGLCNACSGAACAGQEPGGRTSGIDGSFWSDNLGTNSEALFKASETFDKVVVVICAQGIRWKKINLSLLLPFQLISTSFRLRAHFSSVPPGQSYSLAIRLWFVVWASQGERARVWCVDAPKHGNDFLMRWSGDSL